MARKPARKAKGRKKPSGRKSGAGARARTRTRSGGGRRRTSTAKRASASKTAGRKTAKAARTRAAKTARGKASATPRRTTKRATASAAPPPIARRPPSLDRQRKQLRDVEEAIPTPPSSLNMDRHGSAARTGRATLRHAKQEHTETSPALTGGDVDADWEDAYAVGDEAPGGDNPTPDQDRVDDIGKALGIEYQDNEELKGSDKVASRDKHRWELDPASSEDYPDRD
jgi:hypothetical protein